MPLERHPRLSANPNLRDDRTVDWVRIHGRLDPGVDIEQANALVSATVAGLAQRYPATNEFKAATVEPYTSMGAAGRPESRRRVSASCSAWRERCSLIVCLNISGMMLVRGATPRARAVHPRGARRGPAASDPASVLRSGVAGVCWRRAQRVRAVWHSRHRGMVDGLAGSSRDRFRRRRCRDRGWTVPAGERALRIAAGRSLQPSQSDPGDEG